MNVIAAGRGRRRLCSLLLSAATLPLSVQALAGPLVIPQIQIDKRSTPSTAVPVGAVSK